MNPKRYTWSKVAYENVAKKVLEFRQELERVSVEEICKILGIPTYIFTRLGNEKYWFIDIPPKYWKVLQNAVNNLHIEINVIKDHRETPVKVITIDDLKTKKGRGRKKHEDDSSPEIIDHHDLKVNTYIDPKNRDKKIHVVSPKDESEINPGKQEEQGEQVGFVKKETIEFTGEGERSTKFFLKPCKEIPDMYKKKDINISSTPGITKVELSAKALMEVDDQVRRIIKEEIPIIIEDCLCNIKFQIELPTKINT